MTDRYIPAGATRINDKHSDAVAYVYTCGSRPCARVFFGKQSKPVAALSYATLAHRERSVAAYFARRQAWLRHKASEAAARKAYVHDYTIGDVLGTCWGYEQTNRDFYEVTAVKGRMVTLRKLAQERVDEQSWGSHKVVPLPGQYVGEAFTRRAQQFGVRIAAYATARRIDFDMVAGIRVYRPLSITTYA